MSAKKANPLMAGLTQFDRKAAPQPEPASAAPAAADRAGRTPSRAGAVQIAAFYPAEVRTQLKILAAEQGRDQQDLLAEAMNLIFAKYGKAEIAPVKKGSG